MCMSLTWIFACTVYALGSYTVMKDRHVNLSLHEYAYLVMFIVQMSLCWAMLQLSEFFSRRCERRFCGQGVDGAKPFARVSTIKLPFTPFRTKPVWILYKPILLSHFIFDCTSNAGAYTCLCHKIQTQTPIGIVYIYLIIAVDFIMICILHVIHCRS